MVVQLGRISGIEEQNFPHFFPLSLWWSARKRTIFVVVDTREKINDMTRRLFKMKMLYIPNPSVPIILSIFYTKEMILKFIEQIVVREKNFHFKYNVQPLPSPLK